MVRSIYSLLLLLVITLCLPAKTQAQNKPVVWKFTDLGKIGTFTPTIIGKPLVIKDGTTSAVAFNGTDASVIIPTVPIGGWAKFTIQVLFKPDGDGPIEPRFMHFEDGNNVRGTLEIRLTRKKTWYLDAFLKNATTRGLALIDSTLQHPTDRWYWIAMVYDGQKMTSYVNGVKELEGATDFPPMSATGQIAFGARINKVNWFKGAVAEARFSPEALGTGALERMKE